MWQAGDGGGWATAELRLCAQLKLRNHDRSHRQTERGAGAGVPSDSRQLTRPTGEQEAAWNRRPRAQIADCCRSGPVRVPALRLSLRLYFIRRSSPLQRLPSPRDYTTHPPKGAFQEQREGPPQQAHAHTPSDQEDDQTSPSLGVGTQQVLGPEKSGNFCSSV